MAGTGDPGLPNGVPVDVPFRERRAALVAIADRFKLPVHAIGVGEGIDDLQPFDAHAFARAIAGIEEEIAA